MKNRLPIIYPHHPVLPGCRQADRRLPITNLFTLIEIISVVTLLAIVMGLSFAGYNFATSRAGISATKARMAQIKIALEAYKAKTGYYPMSKVIDNKIWGDAFVMDTPVTGAVDMTDFFPGYEKMLHITTAAELDDWDKTTPERQLWDCFGLFFWYRCPGFYNKTSYDLESAGPDCRFGYTARSWWGNPKYDNRSQEHNRNRIHDQSDIIAADSMVYQIDNIMNH